MEKESIDFVILWVDGNDIKWQKEKAMYTPKEYTDSRVQRYRDWENLQYWFRGVEKFAPWVRKIYFVTWGHVPKWLNVNHPKLKIVNHKDFVPQEYLPTFNCNPLEINLHRINGLSEQFVYFNDDTFITKSVSPQDFFKNGKPCDSAILNVHCYSESVQFHFGYYRAMGIINKYFDFHQSLKKNWKKWVSLKYGGKIFQTLVLLPCPRFPGLWQHHGPSSFVKKTYEELWEKENEALQETSSHKFRHQMDLTQALMKAWQIAKGDFEPRAAKSIKSFMIQSGADSVEVVENAIKEKKYKMTTVNDGEMTEEEFLNAKERIKFALDNILPDKSGFEI